MTPTEQAILNALVTLDSQVKSAPPGRPMADLLPLFAKIDALASELPGTTDPELLHFLRKKSYEKARLWLEYRNSEISRGHCLGD